MDINQAGQLITWLDEEHRRDKALLVELRQKVESQSVEINDQTKRIQELEARLSATQSKLTRFNVLEQAIQQVRDELVHMVREQDEEVLRFQRELSKSRQIEQESISRGLNELRRELEAIPPLHDRLSILKAEDQRLGEAVLSIQTRITAHERQTAQLPERITYVEGQRAQDVKTVTQLQEEVVELLRRTESLIGKIELVDETSRKNEQRVTALASYREDLSKRQAQLIEATRLKDALRDQQMQDWQAELVRFAEEMVKQRKHLERFARQQEEALQYVAGIEGFKEVLNNEQKQVMEHQRLSEERQRRELEEWIAANEQRWTKFRLESDARWNRQEGRTEELANTITQIEGWRDDDLERVQKLNKAIVAIQEEYRAKLKEVWAQHERSAVFQLEQVRRWYDEISATVADKVSEK